MSEVLSLRQWLNAHPNLDDFEAYGTWLKYRKQMLGHAGPKKKKNRRQKAKSRGRGPVGAKYDKYMKSAEWRDKSRAFREETPQCERCGSTENLQCHHKHYRTLGKETREDIEVVCYGCHCKIHNVSKFKK